MTTAVLVFAKAPVPGAVKTRLQDVLGPGGAAVLAARLARHTLRTVTAAGFSSVTLCCAPDIHHEFFALCRRLHGVTLRPQSDGDLGARMQEALDAALADHDSAILVGTDIPGMTGDDLRAAADALAGGADAVLGPALDGGYWLIGVRRADREIFDGVPWSTSAVLQETRARMAAMGWRVSDVSTRSDIDRPEDLRAFLDDPAAGRLVAGLPLPAEWSGPD